MNETYQERMAREDEQIKAMEEKLGQPWQTAVLGLTNAAAAHALDGLWNDIVYKRHGKDYGTWEYPGQAYNHLMIEYQDLQSELAALRQALAAADKILTGPLQGYSSIDMAAYKRAKALASKGAA